MSPRLKNAVNTRSRVGSGSYPLADNSSIAERMEEGSTEAETSNLISPSIDDSLSSPAETPSPVKRTRTRNIKKPVRFDDEPDYGGSPRKSAKTAERPPSPRPTFVEEEEEEEEENPAPTSPAASDAAEASPSEEGGHRQKVDREGSRSARPPSEGGSSVVCRACQATFLTKCALGVHVKEAHKDDPGPFFPCDECDGKYRTYESLWQHMYKYHDGRTVSGKEKRRRGPRVDFRGDGPIDCPLCGEHFKGNHSLCNHFKHKHKESKVSPFECTVCPAKFKRANHLHEHALKHDSFGKLRYPCIECKLDFHTHVGLCQHDIYAHGGITTATHRMRPAMQKQKECQHCMESFKCSLTLLNHMKEAHKELMKETKTYKCEDCLVSYSSQAGLAQHRRLIHKASTRDPSEFLFQCELCQRRFMQFGGLKTHQQLLHGGTTEEALSQRKLLVNGTTCPLCKRFFTASEFSLSKHIATQHPDLKGLPGRKKAATPEMPKAPDWSVVKEEEEDEKPPAEAEPGEDRTPPAWWLNWVIEVKKRRGIE